MTKVLIFGTFDLLHKGHEFLIKEAYKYSEKGEVYAIVALDETVKDIKGFYPNQKEKERLKILNENKFITKAILGNEKDKNIDNKNDLNIEINNKNITLNKNIAEHITKIKPDIICIGYDQTSFIKELEELIRIEFPHIKLKRIKPYKEHEFKSSIIRNKLNKNQQ